MTRWLSAGHYDESEVHALIDGYLDLRHKKRRPYLHVRLMDLEVAMRHLPRRLFEAVLVYGIFRFESRAAGEVLHISHTAVQKRYRRGVEEILFRLNGEE